MIHHYPQDCPKLAVHNLSLCNNFEPSLHMYICLKSHLKVYTCTQLSNYILHCRFHSLFSKMNNVSKQFLVNSNSRQVHAYSHPNLFHQKCNEAHQESILLEFAYIPLLLLVTSTHFIRPVPQVATPLL